MKKENYQQFFVGINLIVQNKGNILLGKRINIYGTGTWGLPGGHLENKESMLHAAARELREETGLRAKNIKFSNIVNDTKKGDKHYLQIGFIATSFSGKLMVMEPERCKEWKWFNNTKLPVNIFPSHTKQIKMYLKNHNFSDKP